MTGTETADTMDVVLGEQQEVAAAQEGIHDGTDRDAAMAAAAAEEAPSADGEEAAGDGYPASQMPDAAELSGEGETGPPRVEVPNFPFVTLSILPNGAIDLNSNINNRADAMGLLLAAAGHLSKLQEDDLVVLRNLTKQAMSDKFQHPATPSGIVLATTMPTAPPPAPAAPTGRDANVEQEHLGKLQPMEGFTVNDRRKSGGQKYDA